MESLKPQERRVIGLLAVGYSYREIMELTGWTHTKVNRCSAEGRARLRELGLEIYKSHRGRRPAGPAWENQAKSERWLRR
jgi:hypothetical protein